MTSISAQWEKQVSNLFLYIQQKIKKKKIIIISVLNMAYDILKSRCMLGLAWYREWWSTEVLIRGMKPRLTESSGKFVFGLNKALIILVVFLPNFFFFYLINNIGETISPLALSGFDSFQLVVIIHLSCWQSLTTSYRAPKHNGTLISVFTYHLST